MQENVLRGVRINLPLQTPKDGYHLLIHGFILQSYTLVYHVELENDEARALFDVKLESFDYPPGIIRIPFKIGTKIGKRWGFATYRSLAQVGPYVLRNLVSDNVLDLLFLFLEFYHIAFAPSLTRTSALRALPLARKIVGKVESMWPYDSNRGHNIGRPTLHGLLEFARELPVFGSGLLTGTQHEEARHAWPKQDLERTNRRNVAVQLAKFDADRQGKGPRVALCCEVLSLT